VSVDLCPPDGRYFANLSAFRGERTSKRVPCAAFSQFRCICIVPSISVISWSRVERYEYTARVEEKRIARRILEGKLESDDLDDVYGWMKLKLTLAQGMEGC